MENKKSYYRKFGKRLFDLTLGILTFFLFSPLLVLISVFVLYEFGLPILFSQIRPGLNGYPFTIYKFRTMKNIFDAQGKMLSDEKRLTHFGQFLRGSSFDELPEICNVIKGNMSFVSPRPLLMAYLNRYTKDQMRRHEVKPGITGWAQVNGRNAISWEEKFIYDVWYIDHCSLSLDLKIMVLTAWKILKQEGINQPGHFGTPEFLGS